MLSSGDDGRHHDWRALVVRIRLKLLLLGVSSLLLVLLMLRLLRMNALLGHCRMDPPSSEGWRRDRSVACKLLFQCCVSSAELVGLGPLLCDLS